MKSGILLMVSLFSVALGCATSKSATASALQATATSGQIVTTYAVHAGSVDYTLIQRWVAGAVERSGSRVGSSANLSATALGDIFHVEVTRNIRAPSTNPAAMASPGLPMPPWTPGGGYQVGDTATISITGGGWTQTWTLRYEQSGTPGQFVWITTDYHATRVNRNQPPIGGQ